MQVINELTKQITAHVEFLREAGLSLTVSAVSPVFAPVMGELLKYEAHLPPVCAYLKSHKGVPGRCIMNKAKLSQKRINAPYYSCCWAGVEEFVLPILLDGARVMILNVSGYRSTLEKSALFSAELSASLDDPTFDRLYTDLSSSPPSLTWVQSALAPLMHLVKTLYLRCLAKGKCEGDDVYVNMLSLIHENYTKEYTIKDLSEALSYSESYLRHLFRAKSGTSVARYVADLRVTRARELLESTTLSVADVAISCGFSDPNYFSYAFKKATGLSPLALRKEDRSTK